MNVPDVQLRSVRASDPAARRLLARYFDELRARLGSYAPPTEAELDLEADQGAVTIISSDGDGDVACGTLRPIDPPSTFEVKRTFVAKEARGRGHGRRVLNALEEHARSLGATRIVLDTAAQLEEARRLYARAGYAEIPRYNDNPYAACWYEKRLSSTERST